MVIYGAPANKSPAATVQSILDAENGDLQKKTSQENIPREAKQVDQFLKLKVLAPIRAKMLVQVHHCWTGKAER
ncbi:hypothetical protein TYRP_021047 [Tyrophagus putrescentiae]|nr:hypothetical protein TYRP_021047 [Tyrophagus putrescentiae]